MLTPRRKSDTGNGLSQADERQKSRNFADLRRLAPYLAPYKLQVAGALVALIVAAGTVLGLGAGLRALVDQGLSQGDAGLLDHALIALVAIVVVLAFASYGRFFLVSWLGERVVADLRRDVFSRVLVQPPAFFETVRTGEVLSRLTTDTSVLQTVVGSSLSVALRNLLLLMGGTVMLAVTSPKLTAIVFLLVPVVLVPIIVFGRRVRRLSRLSQDRIADVGHRIDETLNGMATVQAFGGISGVLWMGGHDVLSGRISGGDLAAFVFYAVIVAGSVGAISEVYGDLQRAAGAAERLVELLNAQPAIAAPAEPVDLPGPLPGAVTMEGVRFAYPAHPETAILDGFDLTAAPGETVALVGPSGAGKSTVFRLLLRFYDPEQGRVLIDGVDVRQARVDTLRGRLALVPQEPVMFGTSVADNIRYGRPEASDAEVRAAAEAAFALDFIERLPEGFATFVGERGIRLSTGQRQRIAIARAILRDAPILLLDEATSALDAESEQMVQLALDKLMVGRTTLVIAHRLATVLKADRIVVVDGGRIVASGTHQELVTQGGLYARLADLQFDQGREAAAASA